MVCFKAKKKGFTLVEMLVAMTIFVAFMGIVINSYTVIVRSQREANDYREMYAMSREVFDEVMWELRDGMVDYQFYANDSLVGSQEAVTLISKDAKSRTKLEFDSQVKGLRLKKVAFDGVNEGGDLREVVLGEGMIESFAFYVSPAKDPYDTVNFVIDGVQFQPKVTIYGKFFKTLSGAREPFEMELQTTVSSRIYNQVYKKRAI